MVKKLRTMKYNRFATNVRYQARFASPQFQLPNVAAEVIEGFYNALNPRFTLNLSDLQSLGGHSYADVALRISLLSGKGQLEVRPDRFSTFFQDLRSDEELITVRDCVELSEDALATTLPDLEVLDRAIQLSFWLKCEGGPDAVTELLNQHGQRGLPIAKEDFGAQDFDHTLRVDLRNSDERWQVNFSFQKSVPGADLFFLVDSSYTEAGKYNSFEQRVEHITSLSLKMLKTLGLEPEGENVD